MKIYDSRGMLNIPEPLKRVPNKNRESLVVKSCYCPNGHNLIGNRVQFNGHNGILLKVRSRGQEGFAGLSPVYGAKCRISMDIELVEGEIPQLLCPTCDVELPAFSVCNCGAEIVALFLNKEADYTDCIGICNRVGCENDTVRHEGELLSLTACDSSHKKSGLSTFLTPN
ncbi:MAG: hypothetical protein KAW12_18375 [Candidatus Aminicenantes bacterium]|nr:hypothetical protein [Candidatus Aminicenantes bacterium]